VPTAGNPAGATLPTDPLWRHNSSVWLKNFILMIVLGLLFSLITWWRVIKIKPGRRR
jgi:hypothetical protein